MDTFTGGHLSGWYCNDQDQESLAGKWLIGCKRVFCKNKLDDSMSYFVKWQCMWKLSKHWRQWARSPPPRWQTPHDSLTPEHLDTWRIKNIAAAQMWDIKNEDDEYKNSLFTVPGFCRRVHFQKLPHWERRTTVTSRRRRLWRTYWSWCLFAEAEPQVAVIKNIHIYQMEFELIMTHSIASINWRFIVAWVTWEQFFFTYLYR